MNNHRTSLLVSALAATFAVTLHPAVAQTSSQSTDANRPSANDAYKTDSKAAKNADEAWQRTHRASKLIGREVRNPQGQKIGTVKDLVLEDPQSGRISQVVVAVGGVIGMGDKLFAVPFDQIQLNEGQKYVVLNGGNLAQTFDEKHWPQATQAAASADHAKDVPTSASATSSGTTTASPSSTPPSNPASSTTQPSSETANAAGSGDTSSSSTSNSTGSGNASTPSSSASTPGSASTPSSASSSPASSGDSSNAGTPPSSPPPPSASPSTQH